MRLFVFSDVHANLEALEAVFAAADGLYDRCICLGDVVGYGANPNETTEYVRARADVVVRGNHDRACSVLDGIENFTPMAAESARWTHEQLTEESRRWLAELPRGPLISFGLEIAHGSPIDEDEYVVSRTQAQASLAAIEDSVCMIGHTHLQGGFINCNTLQPLLASQWTLSPQNTNGPSHEVVTLDRKCKYLVNPGSVGQPRDGDWRAAFLIYDEDSREIAFHRVPYALEATQEKIRAAGLPERLATRLSHGR